MTKRDFEAIASAFKGALEANQGPGCIRALKDAALNVADVCQRDNPRFRQVQFMEACGFTAMGDSRKPVYDAR